jgi:hypothetical protein
MENKTKIYTWPDGHWEYEWNIDDMDLFISTLGRSDDYSVRYVSSKLSYDEIDNLVNFKPVCKATQSENGERLERLLQIAIDKLEYPNRYLGDDELLTHLIKVTGEVCGILRQLKSEVK